MRAKVHKKKKKAKLLFSLALNINIHFKKKTKDNTEIEQIRKERTFYKRLDKVNRNEVQIVK